jgi:hypothetical protein
MAISLTRYVNITSGVGASTSVSNRSLGGRFFSTNTLIPTGSLIDFTNASDVGTYFGTTSEEYLRALFYFGWVSKNVTAAQKITFARWTNADSAPMIFGAQSAQALASWTPISSGSFSLTLGATTNVLTGLNFTGAASIAAVATIIQTAVRAQTGAMWTAATVTYDATAQRFNLVGGATGAAVISVAAGAGGSDIAAQLGWLSPLTILSPGALTQSITTLLTDSTNASNNFGSFLFLPALTQSQVVEAATWNDNQNNLFMFSVDVTAANSAALSAATIGLGGTTLTLSPIITEYPEQIPMMILAATDYSGRNTVQNYMYQIFGVTPSVTTDAQANAYDALRVNYYGQTQTAGQFVQFYQRGYMMGLPSDALDQNTYANEIWLKDAAETSILSVLLALSQIPANAQGRAQVLNILQGVIDTALFNGTISPGKTLTTTQQLYITNATGDNRAWQQVQNSGYWVDAVIVQYVVGGITQYKIVYTLIYSKDDAIRLVEGHDILI